MGEERRRRGQERLLLVRGPKETGWRPATDAEIWERTRIARDGRLRRLGVPVGAGWRRVRLHARYGVATAVLALVAFLAGRASLDVYQVQGESMDSGLQDGEYLLVNRLAYSSIDLHIFDWLPFHLPGASGTLGLWDEPGRGDVIVFRSPEAPGLRLVKRVIGVPGDMLEILPERAAVLVNGDAISEPYVRGVTDCFGSCGPWRVPQGHYFVMGDNRAHSNDSRRGWFVSEANIIGKALMTVWSDGPSLDPAPHY